MQCATQAQENFGEHDASTLILSIRMQAIKKITVQPYQADKTTQNCISVERSEKALAQKYNGSV